MSKPTREYKPAAQARQLATFARPGLRCGLALSLVVFFATGVHGQGDEAKLETFLARMGLVDLHTLHVEQQLERASDNNLRKHFAHRLADLYAERLMGIEDDKERAVIVDRIKSLTQKYPEVDTPALRVMLLQADYNDAEIDIVRWINDRDNTSALEDGARVLARIAPQLAKHQRDLGEKVDDLYFEAEELDSDDARAAKDEEIQRLQAVIGRAAYFAGWSNYYLGVSKRNKTLGRDYFIAARNAFKQFLGIYEDEPYDEIEAEVLNLESFWRSRALIGLGISESALDEFDNSRACFGFLEDISVPVRVRDQGPFWFLQGLLNAQHLQEAGKYAGQQIDQFAGGATEGKRSLCVTLIREGFGKHSSDATRSLGELGIRGLARLGELDVIHQLMNKYDVALEDDSGFYLTWIKGHQQYIMAEESHRPEDYQTSLATLTRALEHPQTRSDLSSAAECRHRVGMCRYRLAEYEKAAEEFTEATAALKQSGRRSAVQSALMLFLCYYKLAEKDERFVTPAIDTLKSIQEDFPHSEQAEQADFYIAKLQQRNSSPEEAIERLSGIKPGQPKYLSARYELCGIYHQEWSKARETDAAEAAADEVHNAVDVYLKAAHGEVDPIRKLRCVLLSVEVALYSNPVDVAKAESYLAIAKPFADAVGRGSSVAKYYYYRFLLGKRTGDRAAQELHAAWLFDNDPGSKYERSVAVTMASSAEAAVKAASASEKKAAQQDAVRVYSRLAGLLGESEEAIVADKNARFANSKLAKYEYDLGQYADAADRLEKLLAAFPTSEDYLRRAALAHYHAGAFGQSVNHWRTLLAGVEKSSASWFEAKYYQVRCLQRTDPETAKKVHKQFRALHPKIEIDAWRDRFRAMDSEF